MSDDADGSSVTIIYYRIGDRWWKEPFLNIAAAAAQNSSFTHVEIALGEEAGTNGMMSNVCRVFSAPAVLASTLTPRAASDTRASATRRRQGRRRARGAHRQKPTGIYMLF